MKEADSRVQVKLKRCPRGPIQALGYSHVYVFATNLTTINGIRAAGTTPWLLI